VRYADVTVLSGVTLTVLRGRPLVVIGETGAGKTSLALALMRLCPGRISGRVRVGETEVLTLPDAALRKYRGGTAALAPQAQGDVLNPHLRVRDQVADAMTSHGVAKNEARKRARDLLRRQGLPDDVDERYPQGLSGGEIQRVLIAMAVANDPEVLILDEPTAALDPKSRKRFQTLLTDLARDRCVVLITHDLSVARKVGQDAAVFYGGRVIECGPAARVLSAPRHPYTRALLRASPERGDGKDLQGVPGLFLRLPFGCPFANRCTQRIPSCTVVRPLLDGIPEEHRVACVRGGIVPVLTARGVRKSFRGRSILDGVDMDLAFGETVAICGPSGIGKSTLARVLCGLETADAGCVTIARAAFVPQQPRAAIAPHFTVAEAVEEPLRFVPGLTRVERRERSTALLRAVRLSDDEAFLSRRTHELSGGELQRVAIARALAQDPAVLIADEVTSALDMGVQANIVRLLMNLQDERGLSIVFVTHDLALALRIADRVMILDQGKLNKS